jgi:hypothetical protein
MSQAFIREGDDQWLEDVGPSITALRVFLTRENNGIQIIERSSHKDAKGNQVHLMSNGLSYTKDEGGKWKVATSPT